MNDIPKLSAKEANILVLLVNQGEMYGLQMVRADTSLKRGTIYVTLLRMEDKGYVTSRAEKDELMPGMPRRIYRATGLGELALKAHHDRILLREEVAHA